MKFIHLSDLHIGKRVNEFSMLEDQEYILKSIQKIVEEEKPDAVLIAGDVYDKSVPSAEAVTLFDSFLTSLSKMKTEVFVISGNHDSAERIAFASEILDAEGIHMSPIYDGNIRPVTVKDKFGDILVYMLPFVKPVHVRATLPEEERESIITYDDAVRAAIAKVNIDESKRNVLITHQFVTGAETCESEDRSVGGTDEIDVKTFEAFDYVALGHIHRPQKCGRETVRYCGTPLKYSFSECNDKKSVTIVEMAEKGNVEIRTIPLIPKRDWVELRGTYDELMTKSYYEGTNWRTDYVHVTLTDEDDIPEAMNRLRTVYSNIMKLDYDNKRTRENKIISGADNVENKSPAELFSELFEQQYNQPMSEEQRKFAEELINTIWG